jgi:hypothetical protein
MLAELRSFGSHFEIIVIRLAKVDSMQSKLENLEYLDRTLFSVYKAECPLSDRQSVAKLRGVGSRNDQPIPPFARLQGAGYGAPSGVPHRKHGGGWHRDQTGSPGRRRREPQRGTLGEQPSDPPSRTELRTGIDALERGVCRRWSAAPPTTGGHGPGDRYRSVRGAKL